MTETKNIITHLQIIHTWAKVDGESGRGIDPKCCEDIVKWVDETLELLKTKRPRVLSLDEVVALEEGAVAWLEERYENVGKSYMQPMMSNGQGLMMGTHLTVMPARMSMKGRRFWSARPTEEQREAEQWAERQCEARTDA